MPTRPRPLPLLAPAAAALVLLTAAPAGAHVNVEPSTTTAGEYAVLTVSLAHGCEGSPTTRVAIQLPEEILSVAPTRHPLWEVTKQRVALDPAVTDAHGNKVTERDAVVTYTARTPLPDGVRDAFELSVKLPEEPGGTLVFPAVQTCVEGETAWTEVAVDGADAEDLTHPAPTVAVTAPEGSPKPGATKPAAAHAGTGPVSGLAELGLGAALLSLLAAGTALVRTRRRA